MPTKSAESGVHRQRSIAAQVNHSLVKIKKSVGAPVKYSEKLADEICRRLMNGETLSKICDSLKITQAAFYSWLPERPKLVEKYNASKKLQASSLLNQLIDEVSTLQNDQALAARVRSDLIKWYASKVSPSEYGDVKRLELSGEIKHRHVHDLAPEQRRRIAESWLLSTQEDGVLIEGQVESQTLPALEHAGVSIQQEPTREIPRRVKPAEQKKKKVAASEDLDW